MGLCKSCIEKYKQKYIAYGFDEKTAKHMSIKLLKRIRRHQRYEILKSFRSTFRANLFRWCFLTQWRATILATFKNQGLTWIGRGYNPDYTQICINGTCTSTNTCTKTDLECETSSECIGGSCTITGSCGCPAPSIPNSSLFSACSVYCVPLGKCPNCDGFSCYHTCHHSSCLLGTCGYNCNSGYVWNGSQCVASAKAPVMDGLIYAD